MIKSHRVVLGLVRNNKLKLIEDTRIERVSRVGLLSAPDGMRGGRRVAAAAEIMRKRHIVD